MVYRTRIILGSRQSLPAENWGNIFQIDRMEFIKDKSALKFSYPLNVSKGKTAESGLHI